MRPSRAALTYLNLRTLLLRAQLCKHNDSNVLCGQQLKISHGQSKSQVIQHLKLCKKAKLQHKSSAKNESTCPNSSATKFKQGLQRSDLMWLHRPSPALEPGPSSPSNSTQRWPLQLAKARKVLQTSLSQGAKEQRHQKMTIPFNGNGENPSLTPCAQGSEPPAASTHCHFWSRKQPAQEALLERLPLQHSIWQ